MIAHIKGVATAYQPNVATLVESLAATAPQVENLLLVANDGAPWSCQLPRNVALARQAKNIGLGAAYNLAARWAREQGATHLLLLDQDSVPASGMVAALMEGFKQPALWRDSRTRDSRTREKAAPIARGYIAAIKGLPAIWQTRRQIASERRRPQFCILPP